jgi:glycosyltransferase involved in cell wall biosynthesis
MCRALIARGHEIAIATTRHGLSGLNGNGKGAQLYNGTSTHFFPVQWGNGFKYSRPLKTWLDNNVRNFDVVHIHAVFNHSSIAAARSCRKHLVPYVVRPLGTLDPWSLKQKSFRKSLFWNLAAKRMMADAATIHYTAQAEFDLVKDSLGLTHGIVVPLGVGSSDSVLGPQASSPAPNQRSLDQEHGYVRRGQAGTPAVPGPSPYILFLSRLHPKKGLDVLIKAFVAVHKNHEFSEWRLVIAGDGDAAYVNSLKQLVRSNSADGIVSFIGWVSGDEKRDVLRTASLLVLPSHQENFGLCALEALAEGVPVVVSSDVNLANEIADAGAGWISAIDVVSLEKTISEAMGDDEERLSRGLAGKVFSKNFSWESIAEQLEKMYSSITR